MTFSFKHLSLRVRIFFSMIFLTLFASVLMAAMSIFQFREEAKNYHQERLERKENAIIEHINYALQNATDRLVTEKVPYIFRDKIHELNDIHRLEINFFDLEGNLILSSKPKFRASSGKLKVISKQTLKELKESQDNRIVTLKNNSMYRQRISYTYINDLRSTPRFILSLPYQEDISHYDKEVDGFLVRILQVYTFMLIISIVVSYFLSEYITRSLKQISQKIQAIKINKKNERIEIENEVKEINQIVDAYNKMVDRLEESTQKLLQNQKEQAWREMAKQVAHEIKNPLTPMQLTVQNFERKFDPKDPMIHKKLQDYTNTLLQQIDTMGAVASAFSNFASMPAQKLETIDVVYVTKLALDLFNEDFITYSSEYDRLIIKFDKTQLIRIITNLIKNALQAITEDQVKKVVEIHITKEDQMVLISVKDNGIGIDQENKWRIFQPKFTTKSSGMGLGLAIIKKIVEGYSGTITFESELGKGTTFLVKLPLDKALNN